MQACKNEMSRLMEEPQTEENFSRIQAINDRMDELESREEMYWKQRSR